MTEYYARSGICKTCKKTNAKAWKAANPEAVKRSAAKYRERNADRLREEGKARYHADPEGQKARQRAWAEANPEKDAERKRRWRERNPEGPSLATAKWKQANPAKAAGYQAKRRVRIIGNTVEDVDYNLILERDQVCYLCEVAFVEEDSIHIDHIIAVSKGGAHSYENLAATHAVCNLRKASA